MNEFCFMLHIYSSFSDWVNQPAYIPFFWIIKGVDAFINTAVISSLSTQVTATKCKKILITVNCKINNDLKVKRRFNAVWGAKRFIFFINTSLSNLRQYGWIIYEICSGRKRKVKSSHLSIGVDLGRTKPFLNSFIGSFLSNFPKNEWDKNFPTKLPISNVPF